MTFAVIAVDGTVTEIPRTTTWDQLKAIARCESLEGAIAINDSEINFYCDGEGFLKSGFERNRLAEAITGHEALPGTVILVGERGEFGDSDLSDEEWAFIRERAAAFTA